MERLTVKRKDGRWAIANNDGASPIAQMEKIPLAINRLAAYEDTGLWPEEIETLLAEREAAGWISVEENPPEVGEKCLITDGDVVLRGYLRPDGIWKTGIKPDELWENASLFPPTH